MLTFLINLLSRRHSLRFWNAAFFDAIHCDREVPIITRLVQTHCTGVEVTICLELPQTHKHKLKYEIHKELQFHN